MTGPVEAAEAPETSDPWWRRGPDGPTTVLVCMVVLWAVVMGVLVFRRHDRFASFGFDMGIFDQAVWLLARGHTFITVRGLSVFGHHANIAFFLLAPFSWLGAGAHFLNLMQVGSLALGAVPLYLLGRDRLRSAWLALVPAAVWLLHPSTQFLAWELFHPETVAVTPLLFAWWAARRERWGWYALLLVFAVSWKEDLALAAFAIGLVVWLRGERRVGWWTMGLSLGWFLLVNRVILGALNGEGAFYDQFYGDLGDSPVEILKTSLVDPTRIVDKFTDGQALEFLWQLAAPFALVALAAPVLLLVGLPQVVADILSVNAFTREITFHYAAVPLAALALASVEGLGRLDTTPWRGRLAGAAMVAAALAATVAWGPSPVGDQYERGFWPLAADARRDAKEAAVAFVPGDAAVSAGYHYVPHLSHRERIYEFPNPFCERNWGVRGEGTHHPGVVDVVVVDRATMGPEDRQTLDAVVETAFDVVMDRHGIVVAVRSDGDDDELVEALSALPFRCRPWTEGGDAPGNSG